MNRIAAIMRKEFIQTRRDRMTLALIFMVPLVQLLLFGYAIQTEVKQFPPWFLTSRYRPRAANPE